MRAVALTIAVSLLAVPLTAQSYYRGTPGEAARDQGIPEPLKKQLKVGGRLVLPVGPDGGEQHLLVVTRTAEDAWSEERVLAVAFVPMTGEAQRKR